MPVTLAGLSLALNLLLTGVFIAVVIRLLRRGAEPAQTVFPRPLAAGGPMC